MRRFSVLVLVFCFILGPVSSFAEKKGTKGASEQAREHASDNAIFNRVGDWFATVGKSGEEKENILAERKTKRAAKKARKRAEKAGKKGNKKARKLEKKANKKAERAAEREKNRAERIAEKGQKKMKGAKKSFGKNK